VIFKKGDCGGAESSGDLGQRIRWRLFLHGNPRKTASAKVHRRIEMRAADPGGQVNAEGNRESPGDRNIGIAAIDDFTWNPLSKQNHHRDDQRFPKRTRMNVPKNSAVNSATRRLSFMDSHAVYRI